MVSKLVVLQASEEQLCAVFKVLWVVKQNEQGKRELFTRCLLSCCGAGDTGTSQGFHSGR